MEMQEQKGRNSLIETQEETKRNTNLRQTEQIRHEKRSEKHGNLFVEIDNLKLKHKTGKNRRERTLKLTWTETN